MGKPAARKDDPVTGVDTHIIMFPTPAGEVPTPIPHPFKAKISTGVSTNVKIGGKPAAMVGNQTQNQPSHIPQGPRFMVNPTNKGTILLGSFTVFINKKPAARMGDKVMTCNDPAPLPMGTIAAGERKVLIG